MSSIYFVLNGLIDGEHRQSAEPPQADGWYYRKPGEDAGHGPYTCRRSAQAALDEFPVTYALPLDGSAPFLWPEDRDPEQECNAASVARTERGWKATMEGSYETLVVLVSCVRREQAAAAIQAILNSPADIFAA